MNDSARDDLYGRLSMFDLLYILGTIGFFSLMIGYVSFCEHIGQSDDATVMTPVTRP